MTTNIKGVLYKVGHGPQLIRFLANRTVREKLKACTELLRRTREGLLVR